MALKSQTVANLFPKREHWERPGYLAVFRVIAKGNRRLVA